MSPASVPSVAAPTLLAIDTAAQRCSVALLRDGGIALRSRLAGQQHLELALAEITALLADAGMALEDCDAIAFGSGPGSFTGLRIACGLAQGLAYGSGLPVIAVPNLEALAAAVEDCAPGTRLLAAVDARMGQVYWAPFEREALRWRILAPPALAGGGALGALVEAWQAVVVAGDALSMPLAAGLPGQVRRLPDCCADARQVAALAALEWAAGRVLAPAQAVPMYVRDEVALTVAQRRLRQAGEAG